MNECVNVNSAAEVESLDRSQNPYIRRGRPFFFFCCPLAERQEPLFLINQRVQRGYAAVRPLRRRRSQVDYLGREAVVLRIQGILGVL